MTLLLAQPAVAELTALEDALTDAFLRARAALAAGEPVVVLLDERALAGAGEVAATACAHGLLGLVRALALEGAKPGWRVAALAVSDEVGEAERDTWCETLAASSSASGTLVRLGSGQLGRVPA